MLAKDLNNSPAYIKSRVKREIPKAEKKPFSLPQKTQGQYKHVYAYLLKTRCISRNIVNDMVKRNFLYEDTRGNATFVGFHNGKETFCFQRGCSDKIPTGYDRPFTKIISGSDFEHAWYVDNSSTKLFVTEAVIDSMSVMTMFEMHNFNPNHYDYLSTCGPSMKPLVNYIKSHPHINTVYLGFDNDGSRGAGEKYRANARKYLNDIGFEGKMIDKIPHTKDWNEDLKQLNQNLISQNKTQNVSNTIERMMQI